MAMTQMLMAGAEGEAPIFPSAYQTLIDGYSAGNTRYYDIANGNDSNNGQTEATAKKNLGTDLNSWLGGSSRIAILMPGTYPITPNGPGSYGIRMFAWDTNSKLVCAAGRVTITGVAPALLPGNAGTTCVFPSHLSRNNLKLAPKVKNDLIQT